MWGAERMTPTVIRAPTLAEAQSRAQEAIMSKLGKWAFDRYSVAAVGGDTVITIYWRKEDE
jgi:hypothetical protein